MEKQQFVSIVRHYQTWIGELEKAAFRIHDEVNQKYDGILPYGYHLKLTASYVSRYGYLVAEKEADVPVLYASALLHDAIEDARMSYHDIVRFIRQFKVEEITMPPACQKEIERQVPEIVYALSNEKGRNREERANESYYRGIRETRFASFIKMCDRLANIQYTIQFVFTNRMYEVYKHEHPQFIRSINEGAVTPLPAAMIQEAAELLEKETFSL